MLQFYGKAYPVRSRRTADLLPKPALHCYSAIGAATEMAKPRVVKALREESPFWGEGS
jgi:hypothetical protein